MTKLLQVYQCGVCGNIVEVVHASDGTLSCCGQDMNLLVEGTTDAAKEKHVPVIEKANGGFKIKVGDVAHPMEEKHYIEFIEIMADNRIYRRFMKPGEDPTAAFEIKADSVTAREFCNLHGLWKA